MSADHDLRMLVSAKMRIAGRGFEGECTEPQPKGEGRRAALRRSADWPGQTSATVHQQGQDSRTPWEVGTSMPKRRMQRITSRTRARPAEPSVDLPPESGCTAVGPVAASPCNRNPAIDNRTVG